MSRHGATIALCLFASIAHSASTNGLVKSDRLAPAPSETFTDVEPTLLAETVPWVATRGGEFVFAVVVDTLGRIDDGTVQTLLASDSVGAQDIRRVLHRVRYTPARLIQVVSPCIRVNGTTRHCGGERPHTIRIKKRVLLRLELDAKQAP